MSSPPFHTAPIFSFDAAVLNFAAQIPLPRSTSNAARSLAGRDSRNNGPSVHTGNSSSAFFSSSSFPPLSRQVASLTAGAASSRDQAQAASPPLHPQHRQQQRRPVNLAVAQERANHLHLLYVKRNVTSRFRSWYHSLERYYQWNEAREWYFMQFIRIPPRAGPFPGWELPERRSQFPNLHRIRDRRAYHRQWGRVVLGGGWVRRVMRRVVGRKGRGEEELVQEDPRDVRAKQLETPVAESFRPAGFAFRKRLGVGGQGAVFLLDMVGEDGKTKIPIVAKACVGQNSGQGNALQHEKEAMMCLTGAQHVVQRIVLQALPYPGSPKRKNRNKLNAILHAFGAFNFGNPTDPSLAPYPAAAPSVRNDVGDMRRARSRIDNANDIVVMEYMARGSVQDLIEGMVAKGRRMSNRALWLVLECLFKACVALAYPLRFAEEGKDLYNASHVQQEERVPLEAGYQLPKGPIVHFDLDPQNALIGDYGLLGGAHEFVPSFKVADLGLAQYMENAQLDSELDMWQFRINGKPQFFVPEQFTPEWEYKASIDRAHLQREDTAGNYQWWSNLFQVGWIMWSLITHAYPPVPPTMVSYEYPDPDAVHGNNMGRTGFTYGGQLMEEEFDAHYDASLRSLLMRLLDHNPTQRPKLAWLERTLEENARREGLLTREPDVDFRKVVQRLFGEP